MVRRKAEYYFLCFITYSFIGWVYEISLQFMRGNGFVNRGFCLGPWLPIYGVGGLLVLVIFYRFKEKWNPPVMLCVTSVFTAVVELITTYILDIFTDTGFHVLWDYSGRHFNFQGRVALWPSMKFGIIAVVVIYLLQPQLNKIFEKESKIKVIITAVLFVIFVIDAAYHLINGTNYVEA